MQITFLKCFLLLNLVFCLNAFGVENEAIIKTKQINDGSLLQNNKEILSIDITIPVLAIRATNVRLYESSVIKDRWELLFNKAHFAIKEGKNWKETCCLSQANFEILFIALLEFIDKNYEYKLHRVITEHGDITDVWKDSVSFLNANTPDAYKLEAKDIRLANKLSQHLNNNQNIEKICKIAEKFKYKCKKPPIGMIPLTFRREYLGGTWADIKNLPDLGMPIMTPNSPTRNTGLWFGIHFK